jgi:hypothetical protein
MICGDTHPDHDTICTFRRENKGLLQETFVRVLELAQALKFLQVGQITVAVDGTKVLANASKHAAVSYEHAGKTIQQLDLEVKELLAKAEQSDSTPLEDGLTIPAEIQRRQERKAKLAVARVEIEARAQARAAAEMAGYKAKLKERVAPKEQGKKPRGPDPKEPSPQPKPGDQYNFIDPESVLALHRINAQLVDWASQKAKAGRWLQAGELELFFDDTEIEVEGHHFEGARINYERQPGLELADPVVWALAAGWHSGRAGRRERTPARLAAGAPKSLAKPRQLFLRRQRFQRGQIPQPDRGSPFWPLENQL